MNYYNEIKENLINNEITKKVKDYSKNKSDLNTYYNVGKLLAEAGKHYGEGIIKEYSKRLTEELKVKYSVRVLYKMQKYYNYLVNQKVPTVSAKLTWSHFDELLEFNDNNKINYYIKISEQQKLSVRELRTKIKIGTNYNYIDLLLFNYEYNCFVVVELKVTELKKEHIGQIEVYMNYIDKTIKSINQDKTIGIIIVRKNNKFIMEYCSDKRILSKEYMLIQ